MTHDCRHDPVLDHRIAERFPLHAVLTLPVSEGDVETILRGGRTASLATEGDGH